MSDRKRMYIGIAGIAVVAFLIVTLPGGDDATELLSGALQATFLAAIAVSAARLYRTQGEWLSALTERNRGILYGAIAVALVSLVAMGRFGSLGFGGVLLMILLIGGCIGAIYWVWQDSRRYTF